MCPKNESDFCLVFTSSRFLFLFCVPKSPMYAEKHMGIGLLAGMGSLKTGCTRLRTNDAFCAFKQVNK
jgi:hypothetical protein